MTLDEFPPAAHTDLPPQYRLTPPDNREDTPRAWMAYGLCTQTDPEAFFPEKGGSARDAKRICTSCEVRAQCLEYALANREDIGVWGGTSERQRRNLRNRNPIRHGTSGGYQRGCHNEAMCPRNEEGVSCSAAHRAYDTSYRRNREAGAA